MRFEYKITPQDDFIKKIMISLQKNGDKIQGAQLTESVLEEGQCNGFSTLFSYYQAQGKLHLFLDSYAALHCWGMTKHNLGSCFEYDTLASKLGKINGYDYKEPLEVIIREEFDRCLMPKSQEFVYFFELPDRILKRFIQSHLSDFEIVSVFNQQKESDNFVQGPLSYESLEEKYNSFSRLTIETQEGTNNFTELDLQLDQLREDIKLYIQSYLQESFLPQINYTQYNLPNSQDWGLNLSALSERVDQLTEASQVSFVYNAENLEDFFKKLKDRKAMSSQTLIGVHSPTHIISLHYNHEEDVFTLWDPNHKKYLQFLEPNQCKDLAQSILSSTLWPQYKLDDFLSNLNLLSQERFITFSFYQDESKVLDSHNLLSEKIDKYKQHLPFEKCAKYKSSQGDWPFSFLGQLIIEGDLQAIDLIKEKNIPFNILSFDLYRIIQSLIFESESRRKDLFDSLNHAGINLNQRIEPSFSFFPIASRVYPIDYMFSFCKMTLQKTPEIFSKFIEMGSKIPLLSYSSQESLLINISKLTPNAQKIIEAQIVERWGNSGFLSRLFLSTYLRFFYPNLFKEINHLALEKFDGNNRLTGGTPATSRSKVDKDAISTNSPTEKKSQQNERRVR